MALRYSSSFLYAISIMMIWNLLAGLAVASVLPQHVLTAPTFPAKDKLGAVATESNICSQIGIDVLSVGGNAADAVSTSVASWEVANWSQQMVATTFCVGMIGMYHSGIGGGGFLLVRSSTGSYEFVDFRETAPAAAFEEMYRNNIEASMLGGLARYG
jgi:gamma-glutamyltranspeptidase/glutathione hydrolase